MYPKRTINNIYFDSIDYDSYQANIDGIGSRNKIRLRWYGDMYGQIKPVLEIKVKQYSLGKKYSYPLPIVQFNRNDSVFQIKSLLLNSDLPKDIREHLQYYQPSLLNSYSRRYFLSLDRAVRCTVDFNINDFSPSRFQ